MPNSYIELFPLGIGPAPAKVPEVFDTVTRIRIESRLDVGEQ
jgi:hypothetical protein